MVSNGRLCSATKFTNSTSALVTAGAKLSLALIKKVFMGFVVACARDCSTCCAVLLCFEASFFPPCETDKTQMLLLGHFFWSKDIPAARFLGIYSHIYVSSALFMVCVCWPSRLVMKSHVFSRDYITLQTNAVIATLCRLLLDGVCACSLAIFCSEE